MRRVTILSGLVFLAATLILAVTAMPVGATPSENSGCSGCHNADSAIGVSVTATSSTATNTTYSFTITGPYSGRSGYGVFRTGGAKQASGYASSGSFSVANGASYTFYGVDKDSRSMRGSRSVALNPAAPATATPIPTATPGATSTPTAIPTATPAATSTGIPTATPAATSTPIPPSPGVPSTGPGEIVNSKHNLGSPGSPACLACHQPHNAKGSYLWARAVGAGSGLRPLCYSCHDGSVTSVGSEAFNPNLSQHVVSGGTKGQDCDRCHDPHRNTWKFTTLTSTNADVCSACHGLNTGNDHPVNVNDTAWLPADRVWDPVANDLSGTRLFDSTGTSLVTSGPGYVKCLTCHAAHGGSGESLNTMPLTSATNSTSPLCQNCHR